MDRVSERSTEAAMAMGAVDKVSDLLSERGGRQRADKRAF